MYMYTYIKYMVSDFQIRILFSKGIKHEKATTYLTLLHVESDSNHHPCDSNTGTCIIKLLLLTLLRSMVNVLSSRGV